MLVDSHCHLDHLKTSHYADGLDGLLNAARSRGVERFLSVAVNLQSSKNLQQLAEQHSDIFISAGVHPLQKELPPLPEYDELLQLVVHPKVVAVGETGLDFYYNQGFYSEETARWQQQSFKCHLQVAAEVGKPLIVHTREAQKQTLDYLKKYGNPEVGGVLHCFTETVEMAQAAIAMGYYISFSGIITFRNADKLREVVRQLPLERLLVETDSPWLAPVPHRGQQNEPQYVVEVARCIAELKGITEQQVAQVTGENFRQLFKL